MLKDISADADHSNIKSIQVWNGLAYFTEAGTGLWRTDGTVEGTDYIAAFDNINNVAVLDNGLLFFAENDDGMGLWFNDDTEGGLKLVYETTSLRWLFAALGNVVSFSYRTTADQFFYQTDGTYNGTTELLTDNGLRLVEEVF